MYVDERLSTAKIATLFGCASQTIQKKLKVFGIPARPCGSRPGSEHHCWKGGRTVDKSGYILVYLPSHPHANNAGYVREHRLVMERVLGRLLRPEEVVHHKNDDSSDNRPENLELFERNSHHLKATLSGKCPKWTPSGVDRIRRAVSRPRKSLDQSEQVVAMYLAGTSVAEIQQSSGLCSEAIRLRVIHAGHKTRPRGGPKTVPIPPPDELLRMYNQMPMLEIAERLGCAESSVHRYLKLYGIQTRRRCDKPDRQTSKRQTRKSIDRAS